MFSFYANVLKFYHVKFQAASALYPSEKRGLDCDRDQVLMRNDSISCEYRAALLGRSVTGAEPMPVAKLAVV